MGEIRRELRTHRGAGLTIPQFRVLALLHGEEKTNKDLAESIGLSVAAMSRLVQTLVDEGWLEKSAGKNDRRELRIRLSPQGRKSFEKIRTKARQGLATRLEALSPSDRKLLEQGFRALTVFASPT
jgi:DNA-binding MarR family transcriptional regulator